LESEISRAQFPEFQTERSNALTMTIQTGVLVMSLYSPDWTVIDPERAIEIKTGISVREMAI
jgi:hypothetical protein